MAGSGMDDAASQRRPRCSIHEVELSSGHCRIRSELIPPSVRVFDEGVGTNTRRVITCECGGMGVVTTTPIRFRKAGKSPKDGVIADPKLFLHWPS
jgi:hypothetical protein